VMERRGRVVDRFILVDERVGIVRNRRLPLQATEMWLSPSQSHGGFLQAPAPPVAGAPLCWVPRRSRLDLRRPARRCRYSTA
jgi:hypothetical protein